MEGRKDRGRTVFSGVIVVDFKYSDHAKRRHFMKAIVVTDQAAGTAGMKRDGRLRTNIGAIVSLDDAVATLNSPGRRKGKTIIRPRS